MGNKFRCIDEKGEEISPDELPDAMYDFLRAVASTNAENNRPPTSSPPKDLREFEERLGEFYERQYTRFFGLAFDISSGKTLRKEANAEALVKCLIDFEKNEQPIYYAQIESYKFLKMALEKDAPLFENDMYLLGINRDRSGLFLPQKNVISVQCAAQVLWHLEKGKIPTIEAMQNYLFDQSKPFFKLLQLHRFQGQRTIKRWISAIFPIPPANRKMKSLPCEDSFQNLILIPDIYTNAGVSFPRLIFAISCLSQILHAIGWQTSQISHSCFIQQLTQPIQFYPRLYISDWITESFAMNGIIFD
jgi:hypothetical protein